MTPAGIVWKINWRLTVLTALLLPCLFGLGAWQLQRAEQKRAAIFEFEQRRDRAPLALQDLPAQPDIYTRLAIQGRYDNARSFLLDNRIVQGRYGYEVITPFALADGRHVLVNRGWIEGDPARQRWPAIDAVNGEVMLTGHVYREGAHVQWVATLDEDAAQAMRWPKVIQAQRIEDLQRQLGVTLLPFVVRLDAEAPGAHRAEWLIFPSGFGPERHTAYAVTWFSMAATLIAAWLLFSSNIWHIIRGQKG